MENANEYRDTWRGVQIRVPERWQVRSSGPGLFLHDPAGQRAIVIQPRLGATTLDDLEHDLLAWLMRFDPKAEVQAEPDEAGGPRVCTAYARTSPGQEAIGVFVLQMRSAGGLISGFLAPALTYDNDSRIAVSALGSFQPLPVLSHRTWREPSEGAATALVARGWHVAGGVHRSRGQEPTINFRTWADPWTGALANSEAKLYIEPGFLSGVLGNLIRGVAGQGRFVDAARYAEQHVLPALRLEAPKARITGVTLRPDIIPLTVVAEAASEGISPEEALQGQPSCADVELSFEVDGITLCQVSRVTTMRLPSALSRGVPLWVARVPYSYRAPLDRFAEWQPALEGMAQSFLVDAKWQQHEREQGKRQKAKPTAARRPLNMPQLLAEAERLVCEHLGRPLAIHERPFDPWLGTIGGTAGTAPVQMSFGAYGESAWRTATARI